MIKKNIKYLFILITITFLFCECSTDDTCRMSRTVVCGATFYLDTINSKTGTQVKLKSTIDSLWVQGVGIDSLLYKKSKLSVISLPLNDFEEESQFKMTINTTTDTITVKYKNEIYFLSIECGNIRTHKIDTVFSTNHYIDSIAIMNKTVNTTYVENIQLHHHK